MCLASRSIALPPCDCFVRLTSRRSGNDGAGPVAAVLDKGIVVAFGIRFDAITNGDQRMRLARASGSNAGAAGNARLESGSLGCSWSGEGSGEQGAAEQREGKLHD